MMKIAFEGGQWREIDPLEVFDNIREITLFKDFSGGIVLNDDRSIAAWLTSTRLSDDGNSIILELRVFKDKVE